MLGQESAEAELINDKISILIAKLESSKAVVLRHSIGPFTSSAAVGDEVNGYHKLARLPNTKTSDATLLKPSPESRAAEPVVAVHHTALDARSVLHTVDGEDAASLMTVGQVDLGGRVAHQYSSVQAPKPAKIGAN